MSTLAVKGRLLELKGKKSALLTKISASVKLIHSLSEYAILIPRIEDVDADTLESLAGSLAEQKREYREITDLIKEVEKEL